MDSNTDILAHSDRHANLLAYAEPYKHPFTDTDGHNDPFADTHCNKHGQFHAHTISDLDTVWHSAAQLGRPFNLGGLRGPGG
jgi:hypothetical protein